MGNKFVVKEENGAQEGQETIKYQQILVKPKGMFRSLKVTFDETSNDEHFWGYHRGSNFTHASEAFHVEHLECGKIKIFGISLQPEKYRWYLTVREDADGQVDEPKFLPEDKVEDSNMFLHKEFTSKQRSRDNKISLSFQTIQKPHTVHLVPQNSSSGRIQTESIEDPQYYFKNGRPVNEEELLQYGG